MTVFPCVFSTICASIYFFGFLFFPKLLLMELAISKCLMILLIEYMT